MRLQLTFICGINKGSHHHKLKMAQTSLTKATAKTTKYKYITPVLNSLHRLPIEQTSFFGIRCPIQIVLQVLCSDVVEST